jgi:hypothetical protein
MAGLELSDDALMAVLRGHPELRKRVSSIVLAVEGDEGELTEADAAEERLVEEMRLLGREAAAQLGRDPSGGDGAGDSSTPSDASPG